MTNFAVRLAVATVSGVAGVRAAQADEPAGAQTPDAERAEQIQRIIQDAVTVGRRVETTFAGITEFTEYIPNGDYFADPSTAVIRTGLEYTGPNGKVIVLTKHLAVFLSLFCAEADCAAPPEGMRPDPAAGSDAPCAQVAPLELSTGSSFSPSGGQKYVAGAHPDCTNADTPGGPVDYGDPLDPDGAEPPDSSELADPRNDGVTDPVNPGEPEDTLVARTRLDMYGTLRDRVNPPGTEDTAPAGERPTTGEAEYNPLP